MLARRLAWSDPTGQKQDDEDDDDETRAASEEMVAGAESVASAADKKKNEKYDEDVHDVSWCGLSGNWLPVMV